MAIKRKRATISSTAQVLYARLRKDYLLRQRPLSVDFRKLAEWVRLGDQFTHLIHPYPAKLLPHIANFFVHALIAQNAKSKVLDPFCGTGTVALEASLAGAVPYIADVNPLALLIAKVGDLRGKSICIDITGFMRHAIVFLFAKLKACGVDKLIALYSEPDAYLKQERTLFSTATSGTVRSVRGMHGTHDPNRMDFLIIGVGYDHRLIGEVANSKDSAVSYPVFAFPSLSPDMYQQSVMRAADCGELTISNTWLVNRRFAPANDPFATAQVLSTILGDIDRMHPGSNIYLSPLSTKAQTLGFGLFWLLEGRSRGAVTMLMPECVSYARETSTGFRRLWEYTVELQ